MLTIYKASAGSGKTYNLTADYIRFLLARKTEDGSYRLHPKPFRRHSHILAITFTNKATAEMSERIITSLARLSQPADDYLDAVPYARLFTTQFHCSPAELQTASATALRNLLFDYSYFHVSTIDSFFQSVLRVFTREVELPDNFAVDLDNERAISLGLNELLNSINQPSDPSAPDAVEREWLVRWLKEFMESEMLEGRGFNIFSTSSRMFAGMVKSFRNLISETFRRNIDTIRLYYSRPGLIVKFRNRLAAIAAECFNPLCRAARDLLDAVPDPSILQRTLRSHAEDWASGSRKMAWNASLSKYLDDPQKGFLAAAVKNGTVTPRMLDALSAMLRAAAPCLEYESTLAPLASNIFKLGLLGRILDAVDNYCRENNLVLLSETNNILKGLINNDETPFIYEKLGYSLNHYLIDEFQDTSVMQWDNLRPLLLESLSRGEDNLVIGDEKQSIYRFRNADPELLGHIVADDIARNRRWIDSTITSRGQQLADNSNWRSSREIVTFNNTIFHFLPRALDRRIPGGTPGLTPVTDVYRGVIQQLHPDRLKDLPSGYVKIHFLPPKLKGTPEPSDDNARVFVETELRRLLTDGAYRPADIAILVRSNADAAAVISNLLDAMNRPENPLPRFDILSNDAMTLGSSRAIRLIISILRLVNLPEFMEADSPSAEGMPKRISEAYRRSKLFNRFNYYLHCHRDTPGARPYTVAEALAAAIAGPAATPEPPATSADAPEAYRSLLDTACLTLPGVIERVIARHVPRAMADEEAIFISAFQDAVIDYSSRSGHNIRDFLQWWDTAGASIGVSSPADLDAVKVMTIHQSKGLEFPCVILPYEGSGLGTISSRPEWLELDREKLSAAFSIDPDIIPPFAPVTMTPEMAGSDLFAGELHDHIVRESIDELNVNYVAFTRASRELLVCTSCPASPDKSSSLGAYLFNVITAATATALDEPAAGFTPETRRWVIPLAEHLSGRTFTLGSPTVSAAGRPVAPDGSVIDLDRYSLLGPGSNLNLVDPAAQPVLHAKIDAVNPFDPSEPRCVGSFLHDVLSMVTTPDRLPVALNRMFYKYRIPATMQPAMRRRLEMAIAVPEAARWFSGFRRVITERSMSWKTRGRIETYRPDRIVIFDDGHAEIVDYKFVRDIAPDPWTDHSYRRYRDQVINYTRRLSEARGCDVSGYLWFITDSETQIVKVI